MIVAKKNQLKGIICQQYVMCQNGVYPHSLASLARLHRVSTTLIRSILRSEGIEIRKHPNAGGYSPNPEEIARESTRLRHLRGINPSCLDED